MKTIKRLKIALPVLGVFLIATAILILFFNYKLDHNFILTPEWAKANNDLEEPTVTIIPTVTLIPTIAPTAMPTPITLETMNKLYGPCAKVNVLMYHHIQDEETAKTKKQTNLTVNTDSFRKQMQYLKDGNYGVIGMNELKSFFDNGTALPNKAVIITADDGYKDNYEKMYPILKEFGFRATVFTATGLLNNPDYMTWDDLDQMKDLVYFGNHTWSHQSSGGTKEKLTEEIGLAGKQLNEHGLDNLKVFAYPYGNPSATAKEVLKNNGYGIAFTTVHGNILCKAKSLELPRIRVGNDSLKLYGI